MVSTSLCFPNISQHNPLWNCLSYMSIRDEITIDFKFQIAINLNSHIICDCTTVCQFYEHIFYNCRTLMTVVYDNSLWNTKEKSLVLGFALNIYRYLVSRWLSSIDTLFRLRNKLITPLPLAFYESRKIFEFIFV